MATGLRERFPREWIIVSNAAGNAVVPRAACKRLKALTGLEYDPECTTSEELEHLLVAACVASTSNTGKTTARRKRWARLRAAISDKGLAISNTPGQIPCVKSLPPEVLPDCIELHPFASDSPFATSGARAVPVAMQLDAAGREPFVVVCTMCCETEPAVKLLDLVSGSRGECSASAGADTETPASDLLSAAAVDNTGNVRTWPAEEVFALLLWRWRAQGRLRDWADEAVLEIGAGQSGEDAAAVNSRSA